MKPAVLDFSFDGRRDVRVQVINGEPWFCLKDVCEVLTIVNHRRVAAEILDAKGVRKTDTPTNGGQQQLHFINEQNLYRIIFRSNKPEARRFQDWVFNIVLPTVRKTGRYELYPDTPKESGEPLSRQEYDQLVFLVDDVSKMFHYRNRWVVAIWYALRKATGNKSPNPILTTDLPVMVRELRRILNAAGHVCSFNRAYESEIISKVIRGGQNAGDIDFSALRLADEAAPGRFELALERIDKLSKNCSIHSIE
ncbi:TPA: Bro-N domain-containing protein [Citrobacter freundii]